MKGFNVNDFVIDKVFKQMDKEFKSSKKHKKSKHKKDRDTYDPRDEMSFDRTVSYQDDPTEKFLRNPRELSLLLNDEIYLDGPLKIQIVA